MKFHIGYKIGVSTIVGYDEKTKMFSLQCECGKIREYPLKSVYSQDYVIKHHVRQPGSLRDFRCLDCALKLRWERDGAIVREWERGFLGKKYGKLTVIGVFRYKNTSNNFGFVLKCECGKEYSTRAQHVISGISKQCRECHTNSRKIDTKVIGKENKGFRIINIVTQKIPFYCSRVETECIACKHVTVRSYASFRDGARCIFCNQKTHAMKIEYKGKSYTQVGLAKKFGISRQRVQQIVAKYGLKGAVAYFENREGGQNIFSQKAPKREHIPEPRELYGTMFMSTPKAIKQESIWKRFLNKLVK